MSQAIQRQHAAGVFNRRQSAHLRRRNTDQAQIEKCPFSPLAKGLKRLRGQPPRQLAPQHPPSGSQVAFQQAGLIQIRGIPMLGQHFVATLHAALAGVVLQETWTANSPNVKLGLQHLRLLCSNSAIVRL